MIQLAKYFAVGLLIGMVAGFFLFGCDFGGCADDSLRIDVNYPSNHYLYTLNKDSTSFVLDIKERIGNTTYVESDFPFEVNRVEFRFIKVLGTGYPDMGELTARIYVGEYLVDTVVVPDGEDRAVREYDINNYR